MRTLAPSIAIALMLLTTPSLANAAEEEKSIESPPAETYLPKISGDIRTEVILTIGEGIDGSPQIYPQLTKAHLKMVGDLPHGFWYKSIIDLAAWPNGRMDPTEVIALGWTRGIFTAAAGKIIPGVGFQRWPNPITKIEASYAASAVDVAPFFDYGLKTRLQFEGALTAELSVITGSGTERVQIDRTPDLALRAIGLPTDWLQFGGSVQTGMQPEGWRFVGSAYAHFMLGPPAERAFELLVEVAFNSVGPGTPIQIGNEIIVRNRHNLAVSWEALAVGRPCKPLELYVRVDSFHRAVRTDYAPEYNLMTGANIHLTRHVSLRASIEFPIAGIPFHIHGRLGAQAWF